MDVLETLWTAVEPLVNALLSFFSGILSFFFFWLPDDPFSGALESLSYFVSVYGTAFSWLNWFVPMGMCAALFSIVVSAMVVWVGYMLSTRVGKWLKDIKQTINPGG